MKSLTSYITEMKKPISKKEFDDLYRYIEDNIDYKRADRELDNVLTNDKDPEEDWSYAEDIRELVEKWSAMNGVDMDDILGYWRVDDLFLGYFGK